MVSIDFGGEKMFDLAAVVDFFLWTVDVIVVVGVVVIRVRGVRVRGVGVRVGYKSWHIIVIVFLF